MKIKLVVGKNFGDEGKGLAVDYCSLNAEKRNESCVVLRHNGGAQAGHTVDLPDKRFVFHQLSSGSFRRADTFWTNTFLPDLYKLREEISDFHSLSGFTAKVFAEGGCRCTTVDDVLLNMAAETARGSHRHGSCGMGINEAAVRSGTGEFLLSLDYVKGNSAEAVYSMLKRIRAEYVPFRCEQLALDREKLGEYGELLSDDNVIYNAAEEMCKAAEFVSISAPCSVNYYDTVIFEGAQGLMLDEDNKEYAPHLTSSKTGITNPMSFCKKHLDSSDIEVIYVARSYVTRHGAGALHYEDNSLPEKFKIKDLTNIHNEWQGNLRFARYGTYDDFVKYVKEDCNGFNCSFKKSLMLTHLNETKGKVLMKLSDVDVNDFCENEIINKVFDRIYLSDTQFSENIIETEIKE